MALLGHVSADMSLRYGKLFDATVRTEYERALDLAKQRLGTMPAGRPGLPARRRHRRRRVERRASAEVPARRRVLPAGTRPGRLRLRQHLRALPELPHRHRLPPRPRSPESRRRAAGPRRRRTRLDQRSRQAPQAHRPPRPPHHRNAGRMTVPDRTARAEQACAELAAAGQPVTFTAVSGRSGIGRATLYRDPALRSLIDGRRHSGSRRSRSCAMKARRKPPGTGTGSWRRYGTSCCSTTPVSTVASASALITTGPQSCCGSSMPPPEAPWPPATSRPWSSRLRVLPPGSSAYELRGGDSLPNRCLR